MAAYLGNYRPAGMGESIRKALVGCNAGAISQRCYAPPPRSLCPSVRLPLPAADSKWVPSLGGSLTFGDKQIVLRLEGRKTGAFHLTHTHKTQYSSKLMSVFLETDRLPWQRLKIVLCCCDVSSV